VNESLFNVFAAFQKLLTTRATQPCTHRVPAAMNPISANRIAPLSLGIVAGAASMYVYLQHAPTPPAQPPHPALKYGVPETSKVRYFTNFVSEVEYRTRNPAWVLEHLDETQTQSKAASRKNGRYYEDEEISERFRGLLSQYRQSGYDRGHMSPAMNNKNSDKAMAESFILSNTAPQVGKGFNRDYWARFERFINDTVVPACHDVYVVTGPLYLDQQDAAAAAGKAGALVPFEQRGDGSKALSKMRVPTHFYKVILGELKQRNPNGSDVVIGAFVLPNSQIHPRTPLTSFQVPLNQLEMISGIDFFPKLNSAAMSLRSKREDVCRLNGCTLPPEQFWLPKNERTGISESTSASKR
jgi:endonuclease G